MDTVEHETKNSPMKSKDYWSMLDIVEHALSGLRFRQDKAQVIDSLGLFSFGRVEGGYPVPL
jgi:hypothetical protein